MGSTRWEFTNILSALESAKMEVLKGNKIVMYQDGNKTILIVWEAYNSK